MLSNHVLYILLPPIPCRCVGDKSTWTVTAKAPRYFADGTTKHQQWVLLEMNEIKTLVLAFRGTETMQDVVADLDSLGKGKSDDGCAAAHMLPFFTQADGEPKASIHKGIKGLYCKMREQRDDTQGIYYHSACIFPHHVTVPQPHIHTCNTACLHKHTGVLQSVNKWITQLKAKNGLKHFVVTGHSLGGGLATLFTAEHQNSAEGRPIWDGSAGISAHVITFGAPSVGDAVFKKNWDAVTPPLVYKRIVTVGKGGTGGHDPITMTETLSSATSGLGVAEVYLHVGEVRV